MKKKFLTGIMMVAVMALAIAPVIAQVTFVVTAEVPASDGVTFNVSQVVGSTFNPQAPNFTDLNFGSLELTDVGDGQLVFLPPHFWVIDVGPNGASNPRVDVTYTDTGAPDGVTLGPNGDALAAHATFSYAEITAGANPGDPQVTNDIAGMSLGQANGLSITPDEFEDGFLRITIGAATGDSALQEGNATPFTTLNKDGTYTGDLELNAVFDTPN